MNALAFFASRHPILFTLIGFLTAGVFYWVRERLRLLCAVFEICVGTVTMYKAAPTNHGGGFDQPFGKLAFGGFTNVQYLAIIGAVYLIVRGFDNFDKSLQHCLTWKALRIKLRMN